MHIGIYLGRHAGNGGGIAMFARSLVRHIISFAESGFLQKKYDTSIINTEIVFYGDKVIFNEELLSSLSIERQAAFTRHISSFSYKCSKFLSFNYGEEKKVSIHLKLLPNSGCRHFDWFLDQIFMPSVLLKDRIDLLHCVANYALLQTKIKQVVSVHDLFQAWSVDSVKIKKWLLQLFYRYVFASQFKTIHGVISDSQRVADEISSIYSFPKQNLKVVALGLDSELLKTWKERSSKSVQEKAFVLSSQLGISSEFILMFASSDPRKNLVRAVFAYRSLIAKGYRLKLAVRSLDKEAELYVRRELNEQVYKGDVIFLPFLSRQEMGLLYMRVRILFSPTISEGFGFPVFEGLCFSCACVTPLLDFIGQGDRDNSGVFICDPKEVSSIENALQNAVDWAFSKTYSREHSCLPMVSPNNEQIPRSMSDAVEEILSHLYMMC